MKEHKYYLGHYEGGKCFITWELKRGEFSMCAEHWLPSGRDIQEGGQCVDTIAGYFPENKTAQRMAEIWKRWHLNKMRAGCEHQRANWNTSEPLEIVTYTLTYEAMRLRDKTLSRAALAQIRGEKAEFTPTERALAELEDWYADKFQPPAADSPLSGCYEVKKRETKTAGWVHQTEHPRGLLCKPCEICGYQYGTKWLTEELPQEVLAEIHSWEALGPQECPYTDTAGGAVCVR